MTLVALFIICLVVASGIDTTSVGVIYNAALMMPYSNVTIYGSTCDECLCAMSVTSTNSSISAMNCFTNSSNSVVCQLFVNTTYLGLSSSKMKINLNSTFYYRLPSSNNQSATSTVSVGTSTIVTTTITSAPLCSASGRGTLASFNLSTPSSWTRYSYNYTAVSTTPILIFGIQSEPARMYYIDNVSVVDVSTPNIQLIANGAFENSTTLLSGWTLSCSSSCGTSTGGGISSATSCNLSSGQCFGGNCKDSGILFLSQSFSAVVNHIYTISYWLQANGGGGGGTGIPNAYNHFYVDVN